MGTTPDERAPFGAASMYFEEPAAGANLARSLGLRQICLARVPPVFLPPALPKSIARPPRGPEWWHETVHGGDRTVAVIDRGQARLFTSRGRDRSSRAPTICAALAKLRVGSAVIDGELVEARQSMADPLAIGSRLKAQGSADALFRAFDILQLDGEDLRPDSLEDRRAMLAEALRGDSPCLGLSDLAGGDGQKLWETARERGLQGVVSKRCGSTYPSGRVDFWRRAKCRSVELFAVIDVDVRFGSARSLRLARLTDPGNLSPCGWITPDFRGNGARKLCAELNLGRPIIADVEFCGFTPAGDLRHPTVRRWHAG
jgi:bifunctional non-homologous end joining protein LigD